MLNTLIESGAARTRSLSSQAFSIAFHAAIVAAAVIATQRVAIVIDVEGPIERPVFVRTPEPAPTPAAPTIPSRALPGFRLVPTIVKIPSVLPEIDLTRSLTDPNDFYRAVGVPGGDPTATVAPVGDAYSVDQVDRAAYLLPNSARPAYPDALRSVGIAGDVQVQFVIDTSGRAEMAGLTVLASSHPKFTESVLNALRKARFAPAEIGGRKVKQVVHMPFVFALQH